MHILKTLNKYKKNEQTKIFFQKIAPKPLIANGEIAEAAIGLIIGLIIGEAIDAAEIGSKIDEIGEIGLMIGEAIAGAIEAIEAMFGINGEAKAGAAIEAYGEIPKPKAIFA